MACKAHGISESFYRCQAIFSEDYHLEDLAITMKLSLPA